MLLLTAYYFLDVAACRSAMFGGPWIYCVYSKDFMNSS